MSLYNVLPPPRHAYTTTPTNNHPAPRVDHTVSLNTFSPILSRHSTKRKDVIPTNNVQQIQIARLNAKIPPYGQRSGYVPREPEDFGDGGAFPEIHIKQYPLDMGRKNVQKSTSGQVALRVNEKGEVQYDAILRENMRKDQIMYSKYDDLIPKEMDDDDMAKPSEEQAEEELAETKKALEKLINTKIEAARPSHLNMNRNKPVTVRYQAGKLDSAHNSGATSRLIKIYEMPSDPLDPPKFRHKKLPPRPPSPPVPIMHSPPRQVTVEDQKNWKIPPCVSNWKNNKGFTLPLHQRLAADGRGLYNHVINDKFAKFSEALLIAERQARKEVEARAQMRMKLSKKQKEQKEKELAAMAKSAKEAAKYNVYLDATAGGGAGGGSGGRTEDALNGRSGSNEVYGPPPTQHGDRERDRETHRNLLRDRDREHHRESHREHERESHGARRRDTSDYDADAARRYNEKERRRRGRKRKRDSGRSRHSDSESDSDSDDSDNSDSDSSASNEAERKKAFAERERIRKERERERKRQYRLDQKKSGKNQTARQRERDISEKIALGQFRGKKSTESLYDNRLFNQDSGLNTGFGADDTYNLYDSQLFKSTSRRMYRPNKMDDEVYGMEGDDILNAKSGKIRPHKGFEGAEANREGGGGGGQRGGFEFEKDSSSGTDKEEEMGNVQSPQKVNGKSSGDTDELEDTLNRFTSTKRERRDDGNEHGNRNGRGRESRDAPRSSHHKGYMYAAAGGGSLRDKEDYVASKRERVGFVAAEKEEDDGKKKKEMKPGLHFTEEMRRERDRKNKEQQEKYAKPMRNRRSERDGRDHWEYRERRSRSRSASAERDRYGRDRYGRDSKRDRYYDKRRRRSRSGSRSPSHERDYRRDRGDRKRRRVSRDGGNDRGRWRGGDDSDSC